MDFVDDVAWAVHWNFVYKAADVVTKKICKGGRAVYKSMKGKQNERDNQNGTPVVRTTSSPNSNISQPPRRGAEKQQMGTSNHGQSDSGHGFSRRKTAPNSSGISIYQTSQPSRGSSLYSPTDQWVRETNPVAVSSSAASNSTNSRIIPKRQPPAIPKRPSRTHVLSKNVQSQNVCNHDWVNCCLFGICDICRSTSNVRANRHPNAASKHNKLQRIPPVIPERPKFVKLERQPPIIPERPTIRNNNSIPDWFVTHLNTGRSNTQTRTVCNGDWVNCCYNCGRQFNILSGYSSMCATCRL